VFPHPGGSHVLPSLHLAHLRVNKLMFMVPVVVSTHAAVMPLHISRHRHPDAVAVKVELEIHERVDHIILVQPVNLELVVIWLLVTITELLVGGIIIGLMLPNSDGLTLNGHLILCVSHWLDINLIATHKDLGIHLGNGVLGKLGRLLHKDSIGGCGCTVSADQGVAVVHLIWVGYIVVGVDGLGGGSAVRNEVVLLQEKLSEGDMRGSR